MAVRKDRVQLDITFITDENRALAKTNVDTKKLTDELRKTVKAGGDVADVMRRIEEAGGKVEDIDLNNVAPAQLITRARALKKVLDQLPSSAPQAAKLQAEYKRINDRLAEIRANSRGVAGGGSGGGFFGSLAAKATGLLAIVTGVFSALRGLFSFVSGGVQRAAAFEQLNVSLETFLGSAEKAEQVIKDLNEFSVATPFESDEVNKAGRALLAFGIEQEKLIPTLTRVGDVAAGTGKDFNELALIYGKARAAGRIQGEELNQLAEAGIPIYDELAKVLGVNATEIRKLGEQGRLSFEDLDAVFTNLTATGGRFNGLLDKQSTTLSGLASTAKGAFGALQRNIGEAFAPLLKTILPPVIKLINSLIERAGPLAAAFGAKLVAAFNFVKRALAPLFTAFAQLKESLAGLSDGGDSIGRRFRLLGAIFSLISNIIASVVTRLAQLIGFFTKLAGGDGAIAKIGSPIEFIVEKFIQFIAVINGVISAARVFSQQIQNIFGVFSDSVGLAFDKVKNFFGADNDREIFEGEQRLAARMRSSGAKLGAAFTEGYEAALGLTVETKSLTDIADGSTEDKTIDIVTRELPPKPPTEAQLKKAAKERAEREAEVARRAAILSVDVVGSTQEPVETVERRGVEAASDAVAKQAEREAAALQRARNAELISEEQFALGKLLLRENTLNAEIDILREGNDAEVRLAAEKAEQLKGIEQQIFEQKAELAEKEKELRQNLNAANAAAAQEGLGVVIDLLGQDEEARKKSASAIKAFQKGQAVISTLTEISQIRLGTAAQVASASALGPAGLPLIAGIKALGLVDTGIAIAKGAINVAKINATKFSRGGLPKFGTFGGRSHAAGGTQLYGDDGSHFEVEAGETFAVVNKNARGLLGFLSDTNVATGGVAFARGGIALNAPSTTPRLSPGALAPAGTDNSGVEARIDALISATMNMQTRLTAVVSLNDITTKSDDLNTVQSAAEI